MMEKNRQSRMMEKFEIDLMIKKMTAAKITSLILI